MHENGKWVYKKCDLFQENAKSKNCKENYAKMERNNPEYRGNCVNVGGNKRNTRENCAKMKRY